MQGIAGRYVASMQEPDLFISQDGGPCTEHPYRGSDYDRTDVLAMAKAAVASLSEGQRRELIDVKPPEPVEEIKEIT